MNLNCPTPDTLSVCWSAAYVGGTSGAGTIVSVKTDGAHCAVLHRTACDKTNLLTKPNFPYT